MAKIAIVTTHPIQYYAPVFRRLHENHSVKVFYTLGNDNSANEDPGFGKSIAWDVPLLDGYPYEFLTNVAPKKGTHLFSGIDTPDAVEKIGRFEPDYILIYGWANKSHLKIIRHFKSKLPVYFRGDSTLLDKTPSWKRVLRRVFLHFVYRKITGAFYVGSANLRYFRNTGLKPHQLHFAPHAVDNDRFATLRTEEVQNFRTSLGIEAHHILILFAGKFISKKNPKLLLDVFSKLSSNNTYLLMVGDGVLEKELKKMAKENKHIKFLPFQNQQFMPVVYQAADLFCLPSQGPGESWGLSVNEAMAAKTAVLVSDRVGCAEDLVKTDENGAVFNSGDIDDLYQKLTALCTDKEKLSKFAETSAKKIIDWSFERQIEAFEKIFNK